MMCIPECGSGIDPIFSFLRILSRVKFIKLFWVSGERYLPLLHSNKNDPTHLSEGAAGRNLVPVKRCSSQEYQYRYQKAKSREAITQGPSDIVLYVDENCVSKEGTEEDAKHPPIKEGKFLSLLFWVKVIELISANGGDIRLGATCSDSKCIKGPKEYG